MSGRAAMDLDLLARWRAGDEAAGQDLFARHFDSLYGFFETKCEAEADELVQRTFLACLKARDQFRGHSSFRTYLFTIARHELHDVLREREKAGARLDFHLSSIADLRSTAASRLARSEQQRRMIDALRQLPVEQQTLLELHYWEDLDNQALAEVFEVPEPTIRSRLFRARQALREVMDVLGKPAEIALESIEQLDQWARDLGRQPSE
ncbi:MAG: sigma-70 family RNA polymerase sigma factor [Kofleriaceae bacterium]|jgi:RNA polymerase sigma factor (sigma-70 family)|nr:sigma-70 family RNA polymerase sigma factor [Kofleriaceae bacterium]MBP6840825.1 sigma-70 family RNA polymerase sigma factor [Kofleriaceae bacterium]MBP9205570.1 sigma-70 family RNA polymerase sigma factor [Kofleriaceae bacterium]